MNNMNNLKFVFCILFASCILPLVSCPVNAYFPFPALSGPTGLVRIPDANVVPYKNWNISLDYGTQKDTTNINKDQPSFYYTAAIGAFHGLELGLVGGLDSTGKELRDGVYVNIKYSPSLGDGTDPLLLALGVENLASKTQTGVYMVATRPFKQGPVLSFGFMADFPSGKFRPLGMAGVDLPFGNLSVLADMFGGETVFQANAGLRFRLTPTFALEGRAINALGNKQNALATKDPQQFLFGISWINPF